AGTEHGEADHRFALDVVRHADGSGLVDGRVADQHGLDLRRADALAGDLERVVGSPVDEPVPVLVDEGPVAMDPYVGPARPVRLDVSIGILPESVRHAGPRPCHDQLAHLTAHRLAVVAEALGGHPWDGTAEGARLDRAVGEAREDAARDLRTARVIED